MFFNIAYRLPIWKDIDDKSRNIRILILGVILYVILHSFIYSTYVNGNNFILNKRKYIYYLIGSDIIIALLFMYLLASDEKPNKKKKKIKQKTKPKQIKLQEQPLQPLPPVLDKPLQPLPPVPDKPLQKNEQNDIESLGIPIYTDVIENNQIIEQDQDLPIYSPNNDERDSQVPIYK